MSAIVPDLFTGGPREHGVVRYAHDLATAIVDACVAPETGARAESTPRFVRSLFEARPGHPLHLHFTDRLFGASTEDAATNFERIAARTPVSVTVHDVPQFSDGAANLPRRRECYRRVLAAARGVACNSAHEVSLLQELDILRAGPRPTVIPLAGNRPSGAAIDPNGFDAVAALVGFVYPGKGHLEVIDSVARRGGGLDVIALGAASVGHEADVMSLANHARSHGITFGATGYLSDVELHQRCSRAAVPIAAHQHMSASASILTWLSAGRLPLVADSRYAREMQALRPGTMTLFAADGMDAAIATALADPASTILAVDAMTAPYFSDAAGSYLNWWAALSW